MTFTSLTFLFVLLPITVLLYYLIKPTGRPLLLLIASCIFGAFFFRLLFLGGLLLGLATFLTAKWMLQRKNCKVLYTAGILLNLVGAVLLTLGFRSGLYGGTLIGCQILFPAAVLTLSVQNMLFLYETRVAGKMPVRNIGIFFLYLVYFPKVLTGPVMDFGALACVRTVRFRLSVFSDGLFRFLKGLSKDVLLSTSVYQLWLVVSTARTSQMTVLMTWLGAFSLLLSAYFRLSGYCDMAVGISKMLGVPVKPFFDYPFHAKSSLDFYRRINYSVASTLELVGSSFSQKVWVQKGWLIGFSLFTASLASISPVFLLLVALLTVFTLLEQLIWGRYTAKLPSFIRNGFCFLLLSIVIVSMQGKNLLRSNFFVRSMLGLAGVPFSSGYTFNLLIWYLLILLAAFFFMCISRSWLTSRMKERTLAAFQVAEVFFLMVAFIVSVAYIVYFNHIYMGF